MHLSSIIVDSHKFEPILKLKEDTMSTSEDNYDQTAFSVNTMNTDEDEEDQKYIESLNLFSTSAQFAQERIIGSYKKNVILDTDMGWDDVISLCLLVKNPNINLLGVCVSGLGEAHLIPGMRNAKRILKQANMGHVQVVPGAKCPMSENLSSESRYTNKFPNRNFRTVMDSLNFGEGPLLDKLGFPQLTETEELHISNDKNYLPKAWKFMRKELVTNENQVTIISTGGLTDIEQLFREEDANFKNIERIVIMGGALDGVDGNVADLNNRKKDWDHGEAYETNYRAEWNIFIDPVASKKVFENRHNVPMVMVPLNACNNVRLSTETSKLLHGDEITLLVKGVLEGQSNKEPNIPIYDPLCVLIATENLQSYSYKYSQITVRTEQTELDNVAGQTIAISINNGDLSYVRSFKDIKIITTASSSEFNNVFTYLINMPSPKFIDVLSENPGLPIPKSIVQCSNNPTPKNVGIVVFDKIELLDYTGLAQVFGSARYPDFSNDSVNYSKGKPAFHVFSVAAKDCDSAKLVMTSGDNTDFVESSLAITPDYAFDDPDMPHIDVLVVIGGQGIDDLLANNNLRTTYVEFICQQAKMADYVLGGCSGVLLLAHTKLLNNLQVSTHHTRFEQLHELSKKNKWRLQVVDTRQGRNYVHNPVTKMMTSGGVHCVIAMGLHVVELYMGKVQKDYIAETVMEYTVPVGDFSHPSELKKLNSYSYDPRSYIKGFSHLNVVMKDLGMMEDATDFYRKVLGFQEAWSVWLPEEANEHFVVDAGLYTREEINIMKHEGKTQPVELLVRFLVHPNIAIHIELMMYTGIDPQKFDQKRSPTFLNTYDIGGFRHVALEVDNCQLLWDHLKTFEGVDLVQKNSPPEVLHPDPQTFFYFRDPYGCQWEFEQGRRISTVVKGVVG